MSPGSRAFSFCKFRSTLCRISVLRLVEHTKGFRLFKPKHLLAITASALLAATISAPANAHVSIYPGVSATGSSTAAITANNSGTLNFRIGHGCTDETGTLDPKTGLSMDGTNWATSAFSVIIPIEAQGTPVGDAATGATVPKAQFIPGFRSSVIRNEDLSYTVSWTAMNADYAIPDAPEGNTAGKQYFDFGVAIKWATNKPGTTDSLTGTKVWFPSKQTCAIDMSTGPATASQSILKTHTKTDGTTRLLMGANFTNRFKSVTIKVNGVVLRTKVKLNSKGQANLKLSAAQAARANAAGAVITVENGAQVLAHNGSHSTRNIYVSWDVTDGSGADTVADDTEHNTAPAVTVL